MMGLEEHLLQMFREDPEFHVEAAASHLGHGQAAVQRLAAEVAPLDTLSSDALPAAPQTCAAPQTPVAPAAPAAPAASAAASDPSVAQVIAQASWAADAQKELQKIPFFVRGKARRNTERFAAERGLATITVDTLYDAKAHFSR
jgi:light-independent protochlorophyllide reductase subunit B